MAVEVKLDIFGSTLAQGIETGQRSRAVRLCLVRKLDAATSGAARLEQALAAILNQPSGILRHPQNDDLPLSRCEARHFGPEKALVRLEYRPSGSFDIDGSQGFTLARFRGGYEAAEVWRTFLDDAGNRIQTPEGLPDGLLIFTDVEDPTDFTSFPRSWIWQRPVVDIYVPVITSAAPNLALMSSLLNKINDSSFTLTGFSFAPRVLRFEGYDSDWRTSTTSGTGYVWRTDVLFRAIQGGWVKQQIRYGVPPTPPLPSQHFDGDAADKQWYTYLETEYQEVSFAPFLAP